MNQEEMQQKIKDLEAELTTLKSNIDPIWSETCSLASKFGAKIVESQRHFMNLIDDYSAPVVEISNGSLSIFDADERGFDLCPESLSESPLFVWDEDKSKWRQVILAD